MKKKIKWVTDPNEESQTEGFVDEELSFHISGRLCVTDLREYKTAKEWIAPIHYTIESHEQGKDIANDLLNSLNVELHEANKQAWLDREQRTAKIIADADKILKKYRLL